MEAERINVNFSAALRSVHFLRLSRWKYENVETLMEALGFACLVTSETVTKYTFSRNRGNTATLAR